MLAPPNAGSELPDRLATFTPFRWCTGVNGHRLGTAADALPVQLGDWPAAMLSVGDLGIIAGRVSLNPFFSAILPGADDGKVTVATTHLRGERDHLVLPFSHTWLGWRSETIAQIKTFLRDGVFRPAGASPAEP